MRLALPNHLNYRRYVRNQEEQAKQASELLLAILNDDLPATSRLCDELARDPAEQRAQLRAAVRRMYWLLQ